MKTVNKKAKNTTGGLKFVNLNTYTSPEIVEDKNKNWVKYGSDNNYFNFLLDLFNSSPTNSASINGIAQLIAGRGLDATDSNKKPNEYATMKKLFKDECLKRVSIDLKLFGNASLQVIYNKDRSQIVQVEHYPVETLRAEKCNEEGDIEAYYYAPNWNDVRDVEDTKRIPAYGFSNEPIEILYIKPYRSGYYYYSPVDYQGGSQYIEMESEISNFHLNSLLNGMSPSLLINMNSGIPDEDTQREIESKIYQKYTGTSNAGRIILAFNNSADEQTTVETIQLSDAHQQYQFLSTESSSKILISHRITSPLLLGIKSESGFSSNAEELKNSSILFDNTVIRPFQDLILNAFDEILSYNHISLNLYIKTLQPLEFIDLENANNKEEVEEQTGVKQRFSSDMPDLTDEMTSAILKSLKDKGEDENLEEWELIDSRPANEYDDIINKSLNLASVVSSSPSETSEQDTSIIKVRYVYKGSSNPERDFCKKMVSASKVYRKEDLDKESSANSELSPSGSDTYNIWLYKGGVNCKHFWERRTYLRKNNQRISVNEAIRKITALDPSMRDEARIEQNPIEVAQIADSSNNYWRKN
jgi:hypothetical protein